MTDTQTPQDTFQGRPVANRIRIEKDGDFATYHEAEAIVKAEGNITGSMCSPAPTGFASADKYNYISKWYNMDAGDKKLLAGVITPTEGGNFRNGPLEIIYFGDL